MTPALVEGVDATADKPLVPHNHFRQDQSKIDILTHPLRSPNRDSSHKKPFTSNISQNPFSHLPINSTYTYQPTTLAPWTTGTL